MLIMNQLKKLKTISNLSYFGTNTIALIYPELSKNSLYANIKRWIKRENLVQLKKGMYVTKEYINKTADIISYKEFIANKIKYPSYLSTEYILQKYSILSESVYSYTSISLKSKNTYTNDLGTYVYRGIKESLFTGFDIKREGEYLIKEATKAKALFDYLYLKLFRVKVITPEILLNFRLDLDEFGKMDIKEFDGYCKLTNIQKYKDLTSLMIKAYDI